MQIEAAKTVVFDGWSLLIPDLKEHKRTETKSQRKIVIFWLLSEPWQNSWDIAITIKLLRFAKKLSQATEVDELNYILPGNCKMFASYTVNLLLCVLSTMQ